MPIQRKARSRSSSPRMRGSSAENHWPQCLRISVRSLKHFPLLLLAGREDFAPQGRNLCTHSLTHHLTPSNPTDIPGAAAAIQVSPSSWAWTASPLLPFLHHLWAVPTQLIPSFFRGALKELEMHWSPIHAVYRLCVKSACGAVGCGFNVKWEMLSK